MHSTVSTAQYFLKRPESQPRPKQELSSLFLVQDLGQSPRGVPKRQRRQILPYFFAWQAKNYSPLKKCPPGVALECWALRGPKAGGMVYTPISYIPSNPSKIMIFDLLVYCIFVLACIMLFFVRILAQILAMPTGLH